MGFSPCQLFRQADRIENVSILRIYLTILNSEDIECFIEARKKNSICVIPDNK